MIAPITPLFVLIKSPILISKYNINLSKTHRAVLFAVTKSLLRYKLQLIEAIILEYSFSWVDEESPQWAPSKAAVGGMLTIPSRYDRVLVMKLELGFKLGIHSSKGLMSSVNCPAAAVQLFPLHTRVLRHSLWPNIWSVLSTLGSVRFNPAAIRRLIFFESCFTFAFFTLEIFLSEQVRSGWYA